VHRCGRRSLTKRLDTRSFESSGGLQVTSPIPPERILSVSDAEWLKIIATDWSKMPESLLRRRGDRSLVERSRDQFVRAFGEAVRQTPKRFAALARRIPGDADPAYFGRCHSLAGRSAVSRWVAELGAGERRGAGGSHCLCGRLP